MTGFRSRKSKLSRPRAYAHLDMNSREIGVRKPLSMTGASGLAHTGANHERQSDACSRDRGLGALGSAAALQEQSCSQAASDRIIRSLERNKSRATALDSAAVRRHVNPAAGPAGRQGLW